MSITAEANLVTSKPGFWAKQYRLPSTPAQRMFDFIFGIIAPLLCLFLDPVVFRAGMGTAQLASWRFAAYMEISIAIVALGYYLLTRRSSPFLAGALFGGAVFAFMVGVLILPLSLIGLLLLIGVFGLTPFVTAFVYWRNTRRVWHELSAGTAREQRLLLASLGTLLILAVPFGLNLSASHLADSALAAVQTGSERDFARAVETLKYIRFAIDTDKIAFAYQNTTDEQQRKRLAQAFQTLTGKDIEQRLVELD